jgi:hypothetical protein
MVAAMMSRMEWKPVDVEADCFGWVADERMQRTSHALRVGGGVWLIDPVDGAGLAGRVGELGEPAGVLQLLDRHNRDCEVWASRLGVPLARAWQSLGAAPFEALPVCDNRFWHEVALWEPQTRTLICADALGTSPVFCAREERIGVHPVLRLAPPRSLRRVAPERVLVGHGAGVHDGAAEAVQEALTTARRRLPGALLNAVRSGSGASR